MLTVTMADGGFVGVLWVLALIAIIVVAALHIADRLFRR